MAIYPDLSDYSYRGSKFHRPGTKNIGWLGVGQGFKCAKTSDATLRKIWEYCKISIASTRGIHECEFCDEDAFFAERDGERLLLGSSEIRVFSPSGTIFAAPSLIYHYMSEHHYKPPNEFLLALDEGPCPPSGAYFDRLKELRLEWDYTSNPSEKPLRLRSAPLG